MVKVNEKKKKKELTKAQVNCLINVYIGILYQRFTITSSSSSNRCILFDVNVI